MFSYYLKLFKRNFLKSKVHYLLNILGLTLGVACFLFTLLFVFYENSYDGYHANKDRIYRMVSRIVSGEHVTNTALANGFLALTLPKELPEIAGIVRFKRYEGKAAVKLKDQQATVVLNDLYFADMSVFDVFSYRLLAGNAKLALTEPNTVVLTAATAKRLFGKTAVLNEHVVLNNRTLRVTAVMEDVPANSDLRFEALISMESLKPDDIPWAYTYVMLSRNFSQQQFQQKLDAYTKENVAPLFNLQQIGISYQLEPLTAVHFSNNSIYDTAKGNKLYVNVFLATGILILLIAFINSINMTIVKSFSRAQEAGVQKIFGASQTSLVTQYVMESMLMGIIATVLAFLIIWLLLPPYAAALNRQLAASNLFNWRTLLSIVTALIVLGFSGAAYTGFYMRNIQLGSILRSRSSKGYRLKGISRLMLGIQFFISVGMIVAGLVVYRQVKYLKEVPLGFNPHNVLVIDIPSDETAISSARYLKNQLEGKPNVRKTAFCDLNALPGQFTDIDVFEYQEKGVLVKKSVNNIAVDDSYFDLLQVPIAKGSSFYGIKDSTNNNVIITSLFAKNAGWKDPVGKKILEEDESDHDVIGMVPDFHFTSLHSPMVPLMIFQDAEHPAYLLVRTDNGREAEVTALAARIWKEVLPDYPFHYTFLEQELSKMYRDENNLVALMLVLTLLIVVISCIGLIAYSSFIIRMSSREIAIRRIHGATLKEIFLQFNRQFIWLLLIAFVLACPVAWFFLRNWLEQFAYHLTLGPVEFVVALVVMGLIISTVIIYYSLQSIRINPIKTIQEN